MRKKISYAVVILLCAALAGCGRPRIPAIEESRPETQESGESVGTGDGVEPGDGMGNGGGAESGDDTVPGDTAGSGSMENAETGAAESASAQLQGADADHMGSADMQKDQGGTEQMEYADYFQNLTWTESYKGMEDTNPLMTQRFGADPYAMEYDGRVYFYMTADTLEYAGEEILENSYGKINRINVISTADMVNFTDHGSILAAGSKGAAKWAHNSWAPAAAWKNIDGQDRFFLYFADGGGGIGVLTADSPTGPFTDPLGHGLVTRETPTCAEVLWLFDPAVLVDDDGRAYLYFGGGVPEGKAADPGTARVVELGEDMISLKGEPVPIDVPYLFEDSGIHKYDNKYYYTYCTNWQVDAAGTSAYGIHNAEIASLESDSPMGPFTFKEVILENPGKLNGLYGNNHHCVFSFRGNWYITYHARTLEKAMGIEKGYRCTHVDGFTMGEDGTIGKIRMSMKGREQLCYVDPYQEVPYAMMAVQGGLDTAAADEQTLASGAGHMVLDGIDSGDFLKVAGVDFGAVSPTGLQVTARNTQGTKGLIQVRIDGPEGNVIGYIPLDDRQETAGTGENWSRYEAVLENEAVGVHDVYFLFYGSGYQLDSWSFIREEEFEADCPEELMQSVSGRAYGELEHITYQSETTGLERGANVLLPAGYDPQKQYPVLYFLHGIFGDENSLPGDADNAIPQILGNLAAEGRAREVITVFPNMYAATDPGQQPGFTPEAVAPYDNFIHDLVNDLIPYIESHYSVSTDQEDRAILGFSMGGRETLFIGISRPDLFEAIGAIAPAPGLTPSKDWAMTHLGQLKEEQLCFTDSDNLPGLLMVCCGKKDSVVGEFPLKYHRILEQNGVEHLWYEVPEADHNAQAIRSGLYHFMSRWD